MCVVCVCVGGGGGGGGGAGGGGESIETVFATYFRPDLYFPFMSSHTARKSIKIENNTLSIIFNFNKFSCNAI